MRIHSHIIQTIHQQFKLCLVKIATCVPCCEPLNKPWFESMKLGDLDLGIWILVFESSKKVQLWIKTILVYINT
jgi:hypothetical protein